MAIESLTDFQVKKSISSLCKAKISFLVFCKSVATLFVLAFPYTILRLSGADHLIFLFTAQTQSAVPGSKRSIQKMSWKKESGAVLGRKIPAKTRAAIESLTVF